MSMLKCMHNVSVGHCWLDIDGLNDRDAAVLVLRCSNTREVDGWHSQLV